VDVTGSRNGGPGGRTVHVLELGVRWPPETFLRWKLERLAARGYRVTVATSRGAPKRALTLPGVAVETVLPEGPRRRLASLSAAAGAVLALGGSLRRLAALARAAGQPTAAGRRIGRGEAILRLRAYARLAAVEPDIVQFEWSSAATHYASAIEALGRPVVLSCRGSEVNVNPHAPSKRRAAGALPLAFERATAVACVSEAIRAEAQLHGLDPAKARVVRTGVDLHGFRPPAEPRRAGGGFRVVAVGVLRWLKGWEYALLAVAELARAGVPVSLGIFGGDPHRDMGQASERDRLVYTIDDLGLGDRVRLHGGVEPERMRDELQRADALLHPSLSEGLPNVVLEAMACGLPVVVTDVGGTAEAVTDGVEGLLVPPRDARAAAAALERLWRDPELRARMGAAGRARVERDFALEDAVQRWVDFYEYVLANGAPAR
jgi:glycosyltransferase involved in cell wall biosynthesis